MHGDPWDVKKNLYSQPGPSTKQLSARLKFVKENKSLTVERGWNDHLFLDQCPKYIVSAASKNYIVWGWSDSCIQGDKIAQNESSRALHATWLISLNAATATECVKKTKGGCR